MLTSYSNLTPPGGKSARVYLQTGPDSHAERAAAKRQSRALALRVRLDSRSESILCYLSFTRQHFDPSAAGQGDAATRQADADAGRRRYEGGGRSGQKLVAADFEG